MDCERPAWLLEESFEEYRAKRGEYLSSHQLADFRKSPILYKKKLDGEIPDVDRPAYVIGRAVHTYVLEGEGVFDERYVVGGPVNPKTGQPYGPATKAFAAWADEQTKAFVGTETFELCKKLRDAVQAHDGAAMLLADGIAEGVARATVEYIDCQARIDWWTTDGDLVDLKTCDDLTWFEYDFRKYGYAYQLAFYADVAKLAGERAKGVYVIAVEKSEPYRCGVWQLDGDTLTGASVANAAQIRQLAACRKHATWPTGYEDTRIIESL